jgi:glycosyltransferase involved in cell wall biosynthesis
MKLDKAARTAEISAKDTETVEVSVVLPCLNEGDTLAICIEKAWRGLKAAEVQGEVIVADNGSTDDSHEIAIKGGARLIPSPRRDMVTR